MNNIADYISCSEISNPAPVTQSMNEMKNMFLMDLKFSSLGEDIKGMHFALDYIIIHKIMGAIFNAKLNNKELIMEAVLHHCNGDLLKNEVIVGLGEIDYCNNITSYLNKKHNVQFSSDTCNKLKNMRITQDSVHFIKNENESLVSNICKKLNDNNEYLAHDFMRKYYN